MGRGQECVGAGIVKIATAASGSQHALAEHEHVVVVVVYTVGGKELMHLRSAAGLSNRFCPLWKQPAEESIIIRAGALVLAYVFNAGMKQSVQCFV